IDGRLRILRIRQKQFLALHQALVAHREAFLQAIKEDDGYSDKEAKIIIASALIEVRNHYDALDFKTDLEKEYSLAKNKSNEDRRVPLGIAYIIADRFTTFYSVVSALSAALEAGACVVVELENTLRKTPALLKQVLTDALDKDAFGFVSSRAPAEYLAQCVVVDQTGTVDSLSAQRVLTSPLHRNVALVDRTGNVALAAKEIVASSMVFKGASRYAVDLVMVNEFVFDKLTAALNQELINATKTTGFSFAALQSGKGRSSTKTTDKNLLQAEIANGRAATVIGTPDGGIAQVVDRKSTLMNSKRSFPSIVVCKYTSLDDAIEVLNPGAEKPTPIAAFYLFTGPREAKYFSHSINSQVNYINHIPSQLTVGPTVALGYPTDLKWRYTRAMFEMPSPQVMPPPKPHMVSTVFQEADHIDQIAQRPLKPTGQPVAGAWGFFEQGIWLGALVYVLPLISL
ncbi:uncharacterized protein SETTUDRAFT_57859, partial [Exserohilum turcica Et28A]